jgi:hypothetical protein
MDIVFGDIHEHELISEYNSPRLYKLMCSRDA